MSSPSRAASIPVFVGNVENLEKRITRAYRRTLFGSLTNVWLFDRRAVKPDKANASALALLPRVRTPARPAVVAGADTCPLPLLDHWRDIVLELLQARSMLTRLPFALGPLEGHRLAIDAGADPGAGRPDPQQRAHHGRLGHPITSDLPLEAVVEVSAPDMPAHVRLPSSTCCQEIPWHSCSRGSPAISSRTGTSPRTNPRSKEHSPHWRPPTGRCASSILRRRRRGDRRSRHALGREQVQAFAVEYDAERARHAGNWSIAASTAT